jgi:hypothetical protein
VELALRLRLGREVFRALQAARRGATYRQLNRLRGPQKCALKVLGPASRGYMILPHVPRGTLEVRPAERIQHKYNYPDLDTHPAYCEEIPPVSSSLPSGYPHHILD